MSNRSRGEKIGGATVHVADSYVWATISYLDSSTDYRELLHYDKRNVAIPGQPLQMTDGIRHPRWRMVLDIVIVAVVSVMALLFFLGLR